MGALAAIVIGATRRSVARFFLARRSRRSRPAARWLPTMPSRLNTNEVCSPPGADRLFVTPAQAAAFSTRSTDWRCIGCGKVHAFAGPVRVSLASPCSCGRIEFEPRAAKPRPAYPFLERA